MPSRYPCFFRELCKAYELIRISAVDDPAIAELAKSLGKEPAQLIISWSVQRGTVVLPKSVTPSRIEKNFEGM